MIPVAVHKDVAARRPNVMSGNPDPVWLKFVPKTGPPKILVFAIDPTTGRVNVVVVGRGRRSAGVDGRRRHRQVIDVIETGSCPETGRPLPTAVDLLPTSGHP